MTEPTLEGINTSVPPEVDEEEARLQAIIGRFGDSIEVSDLETPLVQEHIRHLGLLPIPLIERMKKFGVKIIVSARDVPGMSDDAKWQRAPRGWKGKNNWENVPGAYDSENNIVYVGNNGRHACISIGLHEYGHAVGNHLQYNSSKEVIAAHTRLYDRLRWYLQQDGNVGGRVEFFAETFAEHFVLPKQQFIEKYDEAWFDYLSTVSKP